MKLGAIVSDYALTYDTIDRITADTLGIILVQNGVYHATLKGGGKSSSLLEKTPNLYALSEDMQTRGIAESDVDDRVKVITYSDLVDIIMNDYEKLAWC